VVVWVDVCERRGRKSAAKRRARKCRKQRQDHAKLSLAVQYGSREAREDLVVARRRVRMGMGRSGRPLRGDTAYTDPFPGTLRKLVVLVEQSQPTLWYTSLCGYGGEGLVSYRRLAKAKHCWRTFSMPQRHSASHWRRPYQLSGPTKTPRRYAAQQSAYQSTRRCLPQGRTQQSRRGAIASSTRDCTTIASWKRRNARGRQSGLQVAMQSYYVVSFLRLFLVLHSKHISKTTSTQQAKARHPLRHRENCPLPCFSPPEPSPRTKSPPKSSPSHRRHRRAARLMAQEPKHED
jgi:hypothetical protein